MDLKKVPIRELEYQNEIEFDKSYYENTDVLDIKKLNLAFSIKKNNNQEDVLKLNANGVFLLEDARTLETVEYPFEVSFEEILNESSDLYERFLRNSQNTLDILSILWENIVLEIPISYTVAEELKTDDSASYKIVGEESIELDPRLAPLMGLLDKEKE